jgi:putative nucleotidyltransferase with HDIG domain
MTDMSLPLELVAASRERTTAALSTAERLTHGVAAVTFLVGAALLAFLAPHPPAELHGVLPFVVAVAGLVFASRIELEIGNGFGSPTVLLLVPLLVAFPADAVPLVVAAALLLAQAPAVLRGRTPLERCLVTVGNAWYSLAPAAVMAALYDRGDGPGRTAAVVALAVLAQFAVDAVVSMLKERLALGISPRELVVPLAWIWLVDISLAAVGLAVALAGHVWKPAFLLPLPLLGLAHAFSRERAERLTGSMELAAAYKGTALLLGDVVEADDVYTGEHSRHVVELVVAVATMLELPPREARLAEFAALLHDIGKIRVPAAIINKPGPLDAAERKVIEKHTIDGETMLAQVGGFLAEVGRIVRSCHERWDGRGYPDGLAGEQIPLVARVVCCCDAYDAMTSDRPYRSALPVHVALGELLANRGLQFDPMVVDALFALKWREMGEHEPKLAAAVDGNP